MPATQVCPLPASNSVIDIADIATGVADIAPSMLKRMSAVLPDMPAMPDVMSPCAAN